MAEIEMEDKTGSLVSEQDIDDAIGAVMRMMPKVMELVKAGLPELAVNSGNILRCLQELRAIRAELSAQSKKGPP